MILGDHTKLPVLGHGSAAICINGKNIKVRNALCVPDLRGALYSLRRHNHMPGCGTFSHHDVGSFILFPDFMLQVDDSHDYLLSYKPIENPHEVWYDYVEPRDHSARPVQTRSSKRRQAQEESLLDSSLADTDSPSAKEKSPASKEAVLGDSMAEETPLEDSTAEETPLGNLADNYDADPESPT